MQNHEPSNREILNAVTNISKEVSGLSKQVGLNTAAIGEMKDKLDSVAETVDFIKEQAVTRDELQDVKQELREEIRTTRNKMIDHVDNFIDLHKQQVVKHLALAGRVDRHEKLPHASV